MKIRGLCLVQPSRALLDSESELCSCSGPNSAQSRAVTSEPYDVRTCEASRFCLESFMLSLPTLKRLASFTVMERREERLS